MLNSLRFAKEADDSILNFFFNNIARLICRRMLFALQRCFTAGSVAGTKAGIDFSRELRIWGGISGDLHLLWNEREPPGLISAQI
jgi:hypothetical protein